MTDKPRTIKYVKTEQGYMKYEGLNEYPSLNDIKYLILMSLKHFKETNNIKRYEDLRLFLNAAIANTQIEKSKIDYNLNKYINNKNKVVVVE